MDQLDPKFIAKTKAIWGNLAENKIIRDYIEKYSRNLDNQRNAPWRKLFK